MSTEQGNKLIAKFMDGSMVKDHSLLDDDRGSQWMRFKH